MSMLFSPFQLRGTSFRNRLVISPMCQYSAIDGFANDWHLVHLGSRATGGAALVIQEATAVNASGRISPADLGIWDDRHIEFLQRIVRFIQGQGALAGIQLAHAGRKASTRPPWEGMNRIPESDGGWQPVAPSAIPFHDGEPAPAELDEPAILELIADFVAAAHRAEQAGYDVVELHAAHGYLIHQFLSPVSNTRTDQWGGSLENRSRFCIEIVRQVRAAWPEHKPLFVRISATDWDETGWLPAEALSLAKSLKDLGADLIDVSSGGSLPKPSIPLGPGYQVPFAAQIREEAAIPTGAVGLITDAAQAEAILQAGQADLILIARESLRQAAFPLLAASELGDTITWPPQYERAKPRKNKS